MLNDLTAQLPDLLAKVLGIAKEAGHAILPYYHKQLALDVQHKKDKTPLSAADIASNKIVTEGLTHLEPLLPILSEEDDCPDFAERLHWDYYWLVDPLDGTRGFIQGCADFTVNIALVERTRPVLGVIYSPVDDLCYYAYRLGGAFRQRGDTKAQTISCAQLHTPMRVLLGRYHKSKRVPRALDHHLDYKLFRLNSSLKFGVVAEGAADIYPRLGPTSEWDTGAGQCILEEAGGLLVDLNGQSLQYNAKPELTNPEFIALGDLTQLDNVVTLFQQVRREM